MLGPRLTARRLRRMCLVVGPMARPAACWHAPMPLALHRAPRRALHAVRACDGDAVAGALQHALAHHVQLARGQVLVVSQTVACQLWPPRA